MLDKNLIVEDLEPDIWMHLQEVLDQLIPPVKILYILKKEKTIRAVTEKGELLEVEPEELQNIECLWKRCPQVEEIRIYTEAGLDSYDKAMQAKDIYALDIDEYLDYQYRKLKETEGIQIYEKHRERRKHIFSLLKEWIKEDGNYMFWVSRNAALFFNCILQVEGGSIVRVTTSGRYPEIAYNLEEVLDCLKKECGMPVYYVTMEYENIREEMQRFF